MGRTFSVGWVLVLITGMASFASVFATEGVGKVVSVNGRVMARVEGSDQGKKGIPATRVLKPGDSVYAFDVINTGSDSSVKVLFSDQSIMDLGPSTLFKVEEFQNRGKPEARKVEMSLAYGRIRAAINQKVGKEGKFKIRTRAATMGVRGTEFYVNAGSSDTLRTGSDSAGDLKPPRTELVVTEGKVEAVQTRASAQALKPVAVTPGEKLTVAVDSTVKAPEIEKVSVSEMKAVVTTTKIVDQTFAQAIKIEVPAQGESSGAGSPVSQSGGQGLETMNIIKDSILSKPEIKTPLAGPANFVVPGIPIVQPSFTGNFLPGFNQQLARVRVRIVGP